MSNMLDKFLEKIVIVVMSGIKTYSQDEEGNVGELPMVCEGILASYDDDFILITNEHQTMFSLINISNIAKIDLIDEGELLMMDPSKPSNIEDMN